jgi:hypothetical protein
MIIGLGSGAFQAFGMPCQKELNASIQLNGLAFLQFSELGGGVSGVSLEDSCEIG